MGTGEESTAGKPAAPTASTQETPPTATYPDWTTQMQAYYGAAPPPPFFTSNVASPTPHPYVWGGQHLMPPYGTPIPYPGLYPHGGLYPHPGVPPSAPDAVKEIEGKGPDRKERGSTKKSKGNSGNAGLVVGKSGESAKLTSGSGNDGASQSADSGSEGVSQSSDENTNQRVCTCLALSYSFVIRKLLRDQGRILKVRFWPAEPIEFMASVQFF